jgi:putative addiction module component (TIGR02574 family)
MKFAPKTMGNKTYPQNCYFTKNGDNIMTMAMHKIESEALSLDIHSRANLVGKLLLSLDEPTVSEVEKLWLDEAKRRLDDYRAGKVQGIPGNEVFKRAITELS